MNCHIATKFLLNSAGTVKWSEVDKEAVAVTGNMAYGAVSHDGQNYGPGLSVARNVAYRAVSHDGQNHGHGHEYEVVESQPQTSAAAGPQEATYEAIAGN